MMALAGVPFLFSGFWSKEGILHAAHALDGSRGLQSLGAIGHLPLYAGLAAVVLTAFYMTRLVAEVFFGKPRSRAAEHAHENSAVMTLPLVILAVGAIALGFLGTPAWPWLQATLLGETHVHGHSIFEGAALMIASIILVGVGLGAGWWIYGRKLRKTAVARDPLEAAAPGVFAALAKKLGFDELYAATVGRLLTSFALLADLLDRYVIDGAVRGVVALARVFGLMDQQAEDEVINGGFDATSDTLRGSGQAYSRAQTGDAHGYLLTMAVGFVLLVLVLLIGGAR
jgi:NADH-quinone oxidoreductase subunit L